MIQREPVCVHCSQTYRTARIGVDCLGIDANNEPAGIWHADVLKCPGCDHEILSGWGKGPIYTPDADKFRELALVAGYRFRL